MTDIVERLRRAHPISAQAACGSSILLEAADEIERLRTWIARIDAINDDPGDFNGEIDFACQAAKEGLAVLEAKSPYPEERK